MFRYIVIRLASIFLPFIPYYITDSAGKAIGRFIGSTNNWRKKALVENAERTGVGSVNPSNVFINMMINYIDFYRSFYQNKKYLSRISDDSAFKDNEINLNTQFILATGHFGNWDLAGVFLNTLRGDFVTVAESKGPGERMFNLMKEMRGSTGMAVLRLEDEYVALKMEKFIKRGFSPVLLADRDINESGLKVKFGNAFASVPKGIYYFSKRYGLPVLIAGYVRIKNPKYRYKVLCSMVYPEGGARELSESVINKLVEMISRHPEEWTAFDMKWEV